MAVTPYTEFRAPYPNTKVTMIFPKPLFLDVRKTESKVTIKRTMLGGTWSYVDSSDRQTLILPFRLVRTKEIEMNRFFDVYKAAPIRIDMHDGTEWEGKLVGDIQSVTIDRTGETTYTGGETVEVTLTFSALRLN